MKKNNKIKIISCFHIYLLIMYFICYEKKSVSKKCIEFCHLIKHFSLWDYQFQFFYQVFLGRSLQNINLYMQCRNQIIQSTVNKYKKSVLSGVLAQICKLLINKEQWSKLAQNIFKSYDQRVVIQQFVQVVKLHYVQVKKNQNERINGAQFFKICQIMSERMFEQSSRQVYKKSPRMVSKQFKTSNEPTVGQLFKQSLLNDLTIQDRELIRILSCKDKNIARLLQQKHNKMVNMIGQQVDSLRKDIEIEKRRYLQVIEQKKSLFYLIQRLKKKTLQYVGDNNVRNEQELLQMYDNYNSKYNPHSLDVQKCRKQIQNKRLLEVIEQQQRML